MRSDLFSAHTVRLRQYRSTQRRDRAIIRDALAVDAQIRQAVAEGRRPPEWMSAAQQQEWYRRHAAMQAASGARDQEHVAQ